MPAAVIPAPRGFTVSIARKWVFPILRIVVFVVIAAALVKLAFFADPVEQSGEVPTGEIVEPQIPVTLGTIQNDVVLSGAVNANPAIPVKATFGGEVREVLIKQGKVVKKGTPILVVRAELVNLNGTPYTRTENDQGRRRRHPVVVLGADRADRGHRRCGRPGRAAELQRDGHDRPRTAVPPDRAADRGAGLGAGRPRAVSRAPGSRSSHRCPARAAMAPEVKARGSGTTVRCAVPADVRVFAGLVADLTIAGGIAENVLTVPMTAVQGAADTGIVFLVLADGTREERPVTLGLNDGINVEIVDGLTEGEMVLQFVPGAVAGDPGRDPGFPIDPGIPIDRHADDLSLEPFS